MQIAFINRQVLFLLLGTGLFWPRESLSQVTQVVRGSSENGIYAEIDVNRNTNKAQSPEIVVSVIDSKADEIFGEGHLGTNWEKSLVNDIGDGSWPYFEATNSFCGPIELKDANGQTIPLIKSAVSLPEAYPETYSLSAEWKRHFSNYRPIVSLRPMIFPPPLVGNVSELAKFQLQDYFQITKSGQYELTVRPKIYKQSSTNYDVCQRIDIPPVAAPVEWIGN